MLYMLQTIDAGVCKIVNLSVEAIKNEKQIYIPIV